MNLINKKVLAASTMALMLLPFAASANEGGLKIGAVIGQGALHANMEDRDERGSKEKDHDNNKGKNKHAALTVAANASTTAATIVAKATRINKTADFMGSISPVLSARIASSGLSASSTADANAKLAEYNTSVANAKVQAAAAITAAGNISASNATSTNAGFIVAAQADLKAARDFLKTAQKDIMSILRAIFNA